jgi:N-acetyl-gamma-glutamyl-phosphate reductase
MFRGILAVNTARLLPGVDEQSLRKAFVDAYGSEGFIEILPEGSFPNTSDVEYTNKVQIGIAIDEASGRVVVISAIDNLVKGTAGAALQSMNIVLGFAEGTGITEGEA